MSRVGDAGSLLHRLEQKEHVLRAARRLFADRLAPDFDPFEHLRHHETALSRHIGWLLDPQGSHAQGSLFLTLFLEQCRRQRGDLRLPADTGRCRVDLEAQVARDGESRGRVDIAVRGDGLFLLVENKPVARDGAGQMRGYQDVVEASGATCRLLVILRGHEDGLAHDAPAEALTLRLGFEVRDWIDAAARDARAPDIRMYLRRFSDHLAKRFTGIAGSDAMNTIVDDLLGSPDLIRQAVRVAAALPELRKRVSRDLYAAAEREGLAAGVPLIRLPGEDEMPAKWGTLRLDLGNGLFDFALQTEDTTLSGVAFGLVMRAHGAGVPSSLDGYRQAIAAAWGEGEKPSDDPDWLWWDWVDELVPAHAADGPVLFVSAASDTGPDGVLARALVRAQQARDILLGHR